MLLPPVLMVVNSYVQEGRGACFHQLSCRLRVILSVDLLIKLPFLLVDKDEFLRGGAFLNLRAGIR